jgi:hypothetical protein
VHEPPASAQAESVSACPKQSNVHIPLRQHGNPSLGQLHAPETPAAARENAAVYCVAAPVLIVQRVQPTHAFAGHSDTWPTVTQSVSTAHDWS